MKFSSLAVISTALLASTASAKTDPRAQEVKDFFVSAYNDYRKYAFGHDELTPVTKSFQDPRNGWGATILDALDTMYIMGLTDFYKEAVKFVGTVNFNESNTPDLVSVFETTIRYVGGLLSAYELNSGNDCILLQKAQELTNKLAYAWPPGQAINYGFLNFTNNMPQIQTTNIAEAGTHILEFSLLSELTKNATYHNLADGGDAAIIAQPGVFPGLHPQNIDPATGLPTSNTVSWGGGSDSFYEYLIKYGQYTNGAAKNYTSAWVDALDSTLKHLVQTTQTQNLTFLSDYTAGSGPVYQFSNLACFAGGNYILGGRLLNRDDVFNLGIKLTDSCHAAYAGDATGIGPETYGYYNKQGQTSGNPTAAQATFAQQHGYYPEDPSYILRPEVIESIFYAWRATGDKKYQDYNYGIFKAIKKYTKAPAAFSAINDVNQIPTQLSNDLESFAFAETLKYLYLTFADTATIDLDDWVFNTEAHPYIIDKTTGPGFGKKSKKVQKSSTGHRTKAISKKDLEKKAAQCLATKKASKSLSEAKQGLPLVQPNDFKAPSATAKSYATQLASYLSGADIKKAITKAQAKIKSHKDSTGAHHVHTHKKAHKGMWSF